MKTLTIYKSLWNGLLTISDGENRQQYMYYSKRDALRKFRIDTKQVGKHFHIVDHTK